MKKILLILLIITISFSSLTYANTRDLSFETDVAQRLDYLGLFKGVSDDYYALDREPTRIEAVIMLIRLTGQEEYALSGQWKHPFTDVPSWASDYIGYAYHYGLAKGISDTEFGIGYVNCTQYLTYSLRTLGYSDTDSRDFSWDNPYDLASGIKLLPNCIDKDHFTRADAVCISYAALNCKTKTSGKFLRIDLIDYEIIDQKLFNKYYDTKLLDTKNSITYIQIEDTQVEDIQTNISTNEDDAPTQLPTDENIKETIAETVIEPVPETNADPLTENTDEQIADNVIETNTESVTEPSKQEIIIETDIPSISSIKDNTSPSNNVIDYDNQRDIPNIFLNNWTTEQVKTLGENLYHDLNDTVFLIITYDAFGNYYFGTGFFINDENIAITNYHVVKDQVAIYAGILHGTQACNAYVINYDEKNDLALLYVDGAKSFEYLKLETDCKACDYSFVYGFPRESETKNYPTYYGSSGYVVNTDTIEYGNDYIRITNKTDHGNSGGPVLNGKGNVIGVVTRFHSTSSDILAVPTYKIINLADRTDIDSFMKSLNSTKKKTENTSKSNENYKSYNNKDTYQEETYSIEKTTIKATVRENTPMNLTYNKNGTIMYNGNIVRLADITSYRPKVTIDSKVAEVYNSTGMYYSSMRVQAEERSAKVYVSISGTFQINQLSGYKVTIPVYVYNNGGLVYTDYLEVDVTGRRVGDYVNFSGTNIYLPFSFRSAGNYEIRFGNL